MTTRLQQPGLLLTNEECRMLYQATNLGDVRNRRRGEDSVLYRLLHEITVAAFTAPDTKPGIETRQDVASEERSQWTVKRLTTATGRAGRTIRLDIEENRLPASKTAGTWLIQAADATTYINSHRKN